VYVFPIQSLLANVWTQAVGAACCSVRVGLYTDM
jgi:hypothetical protein